MEFSRQPQSSYRHKAMSVSKPISFLGVALLLLFVGTSAFGQTWGEFFNQKKTQKKYLLEQLVALKMYAGYLKKGYDIVGSGVGTVKDIKNGEFSLHSTFFTSLKNVNPAIRKNAKVSSIISLQISIVKAFKSIGDNDGLELSDNQYILGVKDRVTDNCLDDMEELLLVITSGRLEMSDDERIERLDSIYERMRDKAAFAQSFTAQVNLLIHQRKNEQKSINHLREIYGNN
ncbi:hypothetical protein ACFOG5_04425 [Pedobacter fastidiosus]|uniref:TerB family tellurite resistance protein n=1 Tax=Pedobacter fastidiosus TaxID=2765361 RepID=A0ABR7KNB8_9SPHI|nr:hypothetical protein [Pedobacter fastidiosus]MBC6109498.1 hypothetical protein [Pedobacter fastidiosus]